MAQQTHNKPTTTNTTNTTQDKDRENKSSREIEKDIQETRSAISSDIKSLSDKFSPAHIKEEAKNAVTSATNAAADMATDVKDAVVDKAIEVKDVAAEKLSEAKEVVEDTLENVGEEARRIGEATWRFTSANAVPLALIGLGAGWLIANSRRPGGEVRSSPPRALSSRNETYETYDDRYGARQPAMRTQRPAASRASDRARGLVEQAENGTKKIKDSAARGAERMKTTLKRAGTATRDFADENPLAIALGALVAGVGIGLALPATQPESRLMAPAREKFDRWMGDARQAAAEVAQAAKETASESQRALT